MIFFNLILFSGCLLNGITMAYDEGLAHRIRELLPEKMKSEEKKMFGGLAFMLNGHMCVGVTDYKLMVRTGPDLYQQALEKPHTTEMDFTGKPLKGFVYVLPEGIEKESDLEFWISFSLNFIKTLPPK